MKILVVGSGGREHALAWKIAQSPLVTQIICAPGNPGMAALGRIAPIAADDVPELCGFAVREQIDLVVIGPEAPLAAGLADRLAEVGIAAFGPRKGAAQLESSKAYTKEF
ncbi:MAG: phosphoribosylamine--glycine ligase N-terminal domain-containing protein, partial [Pseudomonadota bacterium]